EFSEWAGFFAAGQVKRQAVAAGATTIVTHREADDLVRDARAFHDAVSRRLAAAARPDARGSEAG
ncbi:MAG: chromosome segregation protein SMC, partial [Propionibacteriaceae bacterium]|nr:chromosome segregation protein SMC [Propionibacteriaceae bacterium]